MQKINSIAFLLFAIFTSAQYGKNCELRQLKINLFNPGVEYEMALGVNSTLDFRVAWQAAIEPASMSPIEDYDFFPAITVQNRYYHNLVLRDRRGRQIYGNSGNYIAPSVAIFSPDARVINNQIIDGIHGYAGLVYGIQRSYNSGLSFSIDAGAGYYVGPFKGGIQPVVNLSIGWIISEKRWCVGK
jgi:hypothetical protein